jgi:hypothetical protein
MGTSASTEQRRPSPAVVIGVIVGCLSLIGVAVLVATLDDGPRPHRAADSSNPRAAPAPEIRHAPWHVVKYGAGAVGHVTRADRRRVEFYGRRAGTLVRGVYDALFLEPRRLGRIVRASFATTAARSFLRLESAGAPAKVERLRIVSRRARIGVDARSAKRAVASVWLRAAGLAGERRFLLLHEATLWLQRTKRGWRVIAYDVKQRPVRA